MTEDKATRPPAWAYSIAVTKIGLKDKSIILLLRPSRKADYCDQFVCLFCVCVCPRTYLWNRWTDLHEIFCAYPTRPWLDPPLAALRYVMYFRFYGRRRLAVVGLMAMCVYNQRRCDTGSESDVYECLFLLLFLWAS